MSLYQNSGQYWLRCNYPNNLAQNCGRYEYVLQLTVFKDRIILQVTKASGERGKCATSHANRACNPEHYTDEREKSEHEIIANA
jgi:hypothetical protein